MITSIILLLLSLAFILLVCTVFTNAVEWLGKKLNLSEGAVGSVLAAVGTALPETIIPIIAIVFSTGKDADEIGKGAIAGAPFMLATLGFFITGAAVIVYSSLGKRKKTMMVDPSVFERDLKFFLVVYSIAILTTFVHENILIKNTIAVLLILSYGIYVKLTFSDDSEEDGKELEPLYFTRFLNLKTNLFWIVIQLLLALAGIVIGADLFISNVEVVAEYLGISALILSIVITPIATELPEKLNSIIWIGKKKDTLALGNITGAMVFQSCFPVAFGIILTPWIIDGVTMVSAVLALSSAAINLLWLKLKKTVNPYILLIGSILYAVFLIYAFKIN